MMATNITVPFTLSDLFGGFGDAKGLLHFSGDHVRIEFEANLLGIWDTGVRDIKVTLDDLIQVEFKKGWVYQYLTLRGKSLRTFENVPGSKQGVLEFVIAKRDRNRSEQLTTLATTYLTTREINQIKDDINSI